MRTWITGAGCAFVAAACSTGPNDSPGSAGSGSPSGAAGSVTGPGGSAAGSPASAAAGAPGSSAGAAPVGQAGAGTAATGGTASTTGGAPGTAGGETGVGGAAAGGSLGAAGAAGSPGTPPATNLLVTSAAGAFWKTGAWTEGTGAATVTVSDATSYQTWAGFGGAFNELGWSYLTTKALQDQALQLLFGNDGCRFAWGRIPMGASDYGTDRYTLNETAGDTAMTNFSIARDKQKLIPFIKAAQAVKSDIRFWASPWTPPTWMKSSPYQTPGNPVNAFDGGTMKSDDATLKAHALYFTKFIAAYSGEGIKIEYVAPQNEPNYSQNYPSAIWSPSTFTTFIGKYLGPALAAANPTAQIMLGTMSNNGSNADVAVANAVLADATAKGFCKVIGVQWGMSDSGPVSNLQNKAAGIPIWLSEHKCGGSPGQNVSAAPNDFNYAKDSWGYIRDAIKRGLSAYNSWNMVLDKGGKGIDNTRVWAQNALLVVDGGQIVQTPAYYVFRHVSQYVTPQAKRIDATGGDAIAFKNPDGSLVAIMYNSGAANSNYSVAIGGKVLQFSMPASGWATVRYVP